MSGELQFHCVATSIQPDGRQTQEKLNLAVAPSPWHQVPLVLVNFTHEVSAHDLGVRFIPDSMPHPAAGPGPTGRPAKPICMNLKSNPPVIAIPLRRVFFPERQSFFLVRLKFLIWPVLSMFNVFLFSRIVWTLAGFEESWRIAGERSSVNRYCFVFLIFLGRYCFLFLLFRQVLFF